MPSREAKERIDAANSKATTDMQSVGQPSEELGRSRVPDSPLDPNKPFDQLVGSIDTRGLNVAHPLVSTVRRLQMFGSDVTKWGTASPTMFDPPSITQAINTVDRAVDNIGYMNPQMAQYMPGQEDMMALLPEITGAVQDDVVGPMTLEALFGEDYLNVDTAEVQAEHYKFFDELTPLVSPDFMGALMWMTSGLEPRHQTTLLAETMAYIQGNDMSAPGAEDIMTAHIAMRSFDKQQEGLQERTIIGGIGEAISQPFRTTSRLQSQAWAAVASPQDAWFRGQLPIGQNVAISAGLTPGTSAFATFSGTVDGINNVVGDPIAYAGNMAMGARIIRGQAVLKTLPKWKTLAHAVVPIWGKYKFEKMGVYGSTRFISNRVGQVLFSKSAWEITSTTKADRLWKVLAHVDSPGMIVQRIPEWRNAPDLVAAIALETDPNKIQKLVQQGLEGAFDGADTLHAVAKADLEVASKLFDGDIRRSVSSSAPIVPSSTKLDDMGEIAKIDVQIGKDTLARAAKFVDEGVEATHTGDMLLTDGRKATYQSGLTPGGEKWTIVKVGDQIVSARIGDMAGTHADFGRQGLYTQILEQQKLQLGLTLDELREGTSVTEGAATVMNRVFGGQDVGLDAVDGLGGYTAKRGVWHAETLLPDVVNATDNAPKVILHTDAKVLDVGAEGADAVFDALFKWVDEVYGQGADVTPARVEAYSKAMGYDAIIATDGTLQILNKRMVLEALDNAVPLSDSLVGSFANMSRKQASSNALNKGSRTSTWIVNEMPKGKIPDDIDKFNTVRPKFFGGGSNSSSWWRRAVKARVFGKYPPQKISTTDVRQGQVDLTNFLRFVGVKEDDVVRMVQGYLDVDFIDRHRFVLDSVQEAAELIDNPIIKHNLVQYANRGASVSYGRVGGVEVLTTSSKVDVSQKVARPFIPSMLSDGVDLPDPKQFAQSYQRFKVSQRLGPRFRRGYISKTQDKRDALVGGIRRKLKAQYGDKYKFTPQEIEGMAYSMVGSMDRRSDGLGAASHAATAVNRVWKWGVQAFSISQLVGRALPWYSRVWLDENFRAAFADLPTVMRNPQRFLQRWRDATVLNHAGNYRAGAIKWAEDTMKLFDPIENVDLLRAAARGIIPNLDELAPDEWKNVEQGRRAIASLLNEAAISNDYGQIITGVSGRRQRIYQRAIDLAEDMGFDATKPGFTFAEEIPDIANSGFAARLGIMHATRPLDWTETVTEAGSKQYSAVYHQNLVQFSRDPLIRHTLNSLADDLSGSRTARNRLVVLESNGYKRIEPYIRQWAMEQNYGDLDRVALLERYMDEALKPFVREMYAPMVGDDALEAARVYDAIAQTGRVNIVVGDELLELAFDGGSKGDVATAALLDHARTQGFANGVPPRTLNANMTPFGLMDEDTGDWIDAAKKIPSRVFRFMGDKLSQTGQRQPSYIDMFQREKKARLAMGMPEAAAIEMAHITAGEIVNNIYYNTKSITPFLKSMNNVIPFFTAAWEIAQTWGYKIPMMQGGWGAGHVNVIRKVDRVVDSMRELGLIEFDEQGQPRLVLDVDAKGLAGPGDTVSRAGAQILRQPLRLLEHVLNLGHAARNMDMDIERGDSAVPDRFEIMVSSPVDIQSHGVGTAFDVALGQMPLVSWATTNVRKLLPLVAKTKSTAATGTFAEFAEENDVDVFRTMALNMPAIEEAIGSDAMVSLLKGKIDPADVDLTGVKLDIPNTSLWATLTDDLWYPYGDTQSFSDVGAGFKPTWIEYALRGFGIWRDGNDADGFVGIDLASNTESAVNGSILSAARHMNFETGAFENIDKYRDEFYALAQPHLDVGNMEIVNDMLVVNGEAPSNVDEVNAAWDKLTLYSDAVWTRAVEDGASSNIMRSFLAAILPGSARFFFAEERALDAYYQGRDPEAPFRRTSIDDVMDYMLLWAQDPAGGSAVRKFLGNNPTMGPYLVGKTYWGPGGTPPLDRSTEQYFADLDAGLVRPVPFGAWQTRDAIRDNEFMRQIAVKEMYGDNPYEVAALTLSDPQKYGEMSQEFTQKHHMMMWEDELRGGDYAEWKDRNREDQFSIREESIRTFNDVSSTISDTIQMLEVTPLLNSAERRETIGTLKQMNAGIREFTKEMEIGDKNFDFLAPWQKLRIRWFEEGYLPYSEAVGVIYEKINNADTAVEQDRLWAEMAELNNGLGSTDILIDGFRFPPPMVFKWNNKDPEVREADTLKSTIYKTGWLDNDQIDRLVAANPDMGKYLPTTPYQRDIWKQYNDWYDEIDARWDGGAQGGIEQKERNKQRDNLEEQLREVLSREGLSDQIVWLDLWPIQKLNLADSLPPLLQDSEWIGYVNGIQQIRAADGYSSVGDDHAGRRAMQRLLIDRVTSDPQFRAELVELGIQLYGEELPEAIIPKLFFNDQF